ncbi:6,7-dimethyl-8-ribityllumazine synthase [Aggregicoccus sp. 17bor-14]|uniref:6,7-dimethyl-8-ribityllumazine synthase n=1 Tax=Myxococcaceae TaxID=31 RepID=UPI00129C2860|nr:MULTISPECIES: 6,7-dimethyl-8-ribityllumazine synthase [Myxococcaceae]MBF5046360.1 6,7-dimethyl-8-ribityllumazine synthase [Simulacricoccus sp. 17bor-14]MRI92080.1 6,7-dimethyl-8-ribityllumazine synthase [Aggregicoccus sp. 17bor-14]
MPRFIEGNFLPPQGRFAICVARFNGFITEALVQGAVDTLVRHGVADDAIDVYRVPGTYELPGLTRRVSEMNRYAGIITLGAVIRGGTPHFDYVAGECAKGIGQVAFTSSASVTFGVLTCDTVEQAIDRAGVKAGNKGAEAALACIEMVNLHAQLAKLDGKKG